MASEDTGVAAIATDLDGTLWDSSIDVHPATIEALIELDRRGVPVVAATGRRARSARIGFESNGIMLPTVSLDGILGEHEPLVGPRFHERSFVPADARRVIEIFLEHGVQPCVFVDDPVLDVVLDEHPSTHPEHVKICEQHGLTTLLESWAVDLPVFSFTVIGGTPELLSPVATALTGAGLAHTTVSTDPLYGGVSIAAVPAGVSKWSGVTSFCADQGIDPSRVLAVGDAQNDIAMLKASACAVVVETAPAEVTDVADQVIPGPASGGWAAVLDLL